MEKIAIYAGRLDPITNGHIDVIRKALLFVDKIIIAVPEKSVKEAFFSIEDRVKLIKESTKGTNVEVIIFSGLIADFARKKKCNLLIRGVRGSSDVDYEMQMAYRNAKMNPKLTTIFIAASEDYCHISSTLVKDIAASGYRESLADMVPKCVEKVLRSAF